MKLTKREQQIRTFLLEEHRRTIDRAAESCDSGYANGQLNEASTILGKVLDILGG